MRVATVEDFKPNVLLERISDQTKVRILDHVRGDEFTSIHEGFQVEITIHAREANCYNLVADDASQYFENLKQEIEKMEVDNNNIAIYSSINGVGRTYLAHELAKSKGMNFVSLDHQDGGSLSNAKEANNAILDCEPYFEHALEVVKYSNKLIYVLSAKTFQYSPAHCIKKLEEEVEALTDINSNLDVEFRLSELEKWPDELASFLGKLVTNNV